MNESKKYYEKEVERLLSKSHNLDCIKKYNRLMSDCLKSLKESSDSGYLQNIEFSIKEIDNNLIHIK